ncbi:hypothetical protein BS50DRAFT_567626 [Corynespora cassiicola Philippines]|uniref:Uncharacterized protein n=1 Tax=Corynespora cassiicola Philippines TaxID=1448308 RepID=A0A2T2PBD7_CORCC|nr:hypothetical protein BS50DRAFT_567626 [Corynespora cassiicola Philippines]
MLFSKVFLGAIAAHIAMADFLILDPEAEEQLLTMDELEELEEDLTHWATTKINDPAYSSHMSKFSEYVVTRTDAPASVLLATTTVTSYTTTPEWYKAMPTDLQNYFEGAADDVNEIISDVLEDSTVPASSTVLEGNAPKPTAAGQYLGLGAAAMAGAAIFL